MKNDGRPAFPAGSIRKTRERPHDAGSNFIVSDMVEPRYRGMSLRDYFIAHAPAEPQPWFKPEMPERPYLLSPFVELTEEQRDIWDRYRDADPDDIPDAVVRDYVVRREQKAEQFNEWDKERKKQRYIQWPAAWADAMLAERESSGGGE